MSPIQRLRPPGLVKSPAFSHVAVAPPGATTIYVGGQNAVDGDGRLVGDGDAALQPAGAVHDAKPAREAAGEGVEAVIQWTVLLVEGADLSAGYGGIAAQRASEGPRLVTVAFEEG